MKLTTENKKSVEKLIAKKISPTAMRILTLDFLLEQSRAVSLSEIENYFFISDRITLYRTLKTFEKKGLIHSIQENNTTKYALCQENCSEYLHHDNHLHFYCIECKNTICLEQMELNNIKLPSSFKVSEFRFFAKGICDKCVVVQTMQ